MTSVSTDRRFGVNSSAAVKVPCRVATTANITLSGHQTIDGVLLTDDDRVLVKNQTDQKENGIYVVDSGTWTRAPDWDGSYDAKAGSLVYITSGTTNGGALYVCTTSDPITIGTTNAAFAVVALSSLITLPLPLAQGGTGGASAISSLANLGVIQVTAEGGTANAQTGTVDALVTALRPDQLFIFVPSVTNTGPTTLAINALIAKAVRANGVALVGGELAAGVPVLLHYDGFFSIVGAGLFRNLAQDLTPDKTADYFYTYDASAGVYKRVLMQDAPLPRMAISGLTYANNVSDATNDIDIAVGSCRDATDATNLLLTSTLTKRLDAAWAVGTNQGGLDTGAIGNSDYYIWLIKRSDTGVVDALFSLSSTAPTMPTSYDYKRLIGWFKRVGATIVALTTYETEGGGLEMKWTTPTLDVNLSNTLTTARRTDAIKVPLNFSVVADINVYVSDAGASGQTIIYCPDHADVTPAAGAAPLTTLESITTLAGSRNMQVRTSATGTIAARSTIATVDSYLVSTLGFRWARRN